MAINKSKCKQFIAYFIALFVLFFIFGYESIYSDTIGSTISKLNISTYHSGLINDFPYSENSHYYNELNFNKLANYVPEQKDPFIAGFLSWLMMGVGQIYCKEYTKGSIFIALDLLDKGALIALTSYVNNKYSPKGEEIININWSTFDSNTKLLVIGYVIAKYSIRFYNVYDAIQSAKNYNKIHFLSREKAGLSFGIGSNSLQVGYSLELK